MCTHMICVPCMLMHFLMLQFHLDLQQIFWYPLLQLRLMLHGRLHYLLENYLVRMILLFAGFTVWLKNFAGEEYRQAQLPFYCRNISRNFFSQCSKSCYVIINTGDIICVQICQREQVAKLAKIFSWRKFLALQ